ncbi:Putative undecaprenyl-phosphate N-acetylgalactosaminyl 1-phosphate transferase [Pelagimonas phthalicica]|uniref:Putative undecaprenyl-phosphate N-acetylgalactosaminyl 1-phosphate transferase n=1 Tax=Pelagimonas phthalicica TaxID=1037362 RepID=A0A238JIQ0_9RHOB|nr:MULTISPECIES: sugar transferase [Roseobacteraceae]MBO9465902.1 sugar transferase [Tropicibacter sp. R15_0]TDS89654.1 lipopolysaccharide/colanic/teichoic acid biosynthesis glycosyltransferase [Pelagimonas phthalicica]SMX29822.1 Putative undecaprenyl-phosphate N-acetylgalactosaminyl 1-phosphate transferase [Pelagimonas phthalicica]
MTLHIRQPLPTAKIDALIDEALFATSKATSYRDYAKRALDVTLVLIAALPVLFFVAIFAAVVALDGKSPFYMQKRVGQNGRIFRMWKLRSMVSNADEMLKQHLAADPAARAEWDRFQKLSNDPRITKIGQLIRKTSIDELPQLWNVLRGDMSLVGPRPMMPCQQEIYPGTAYYALRPGITGFWQTSVRNESSFSERAAFDTAYLRELSFATDVKTILKTFKVVVRGTGC